MPNGKRKPKPSAPADSTARPCGVVDCPQPAEDGKKFCVVHSVQGRWHRKLTGTADRALKRGDLFTGALAFVGAQLTARDTLGRAATSVLQGAKAPEGQTPLDALSQRAWQRVVGLSGAAAAAAAPPPPVAKASPFEELGLDAKTATEAEVRERQRQLAKIWHADRTKSMAAEARLKQVNAAAAECLKVIRQRVRQP